VKAEEKTKEQLIQEQKQLIETIIDHIPNSIFWKNRDSVYVGGNQHFINTFGQGKPENIIGKSVRDLPISEEQMALALETDRKVVEEGQSLINYEERVATPDGQEIVSLTSKAPLRDKAGTIVGLVTVTPSASRRRRRCGRARNASTLPWKRPPMVYLIGICKRAKCTSVLVTIPCLAMNLMKYPRPMIPG